MKAQQNQPPHLTRSTKGRERTGIKISVVVLLCLIFIVLGIFLVTPSTIGQKERRDEPTLVRRGELTDREKVYSEEFQKRYAWRQGKSIPDLSAAAKRRGDGKETGFAINVGTVPTVGDFQAESVEKFLRGLACDADAVVVGSVTNKEARLTEDEAFVFTKYQFVVDDVLKNNPLSGIALKDQIEVTRPGGLVSLDGQVVRVEDRAYEPFEKETRYVLFLRYLPGANGYAVFNAQSDFRIGKNFIEHLSKVGGPSELKKIEDAQTLLSKIKISASTDCFEKSTGGN